MKIYSNLKIFNFLEKITSLPRDKPILPPVHIRFKPTNKCNHRCRYCAYLDPHMQLGKDMKEQDSIPHEKMLEICHDIVAMGVKAVTFSGGGEPFVYPHLLEAVQILHAGGVQFASLTNGGRLQGEIAEFFAYNATWVRISMDGYDDESYTRYRNVKHGEYTKIMQNIKNFAQYNGNCVLGVSYIVDADNYKHILTVLRRYKDLGVRSVKVSACITSNSAQETNAYHAPHFLQAAELISKASQELEDENFEIFNAWHTVNERFGQNYSWCPFSQIVPVIGADMGIYPCHDKAYNDEALLGKVDDINFKEWWMSHKEAFFKIRPCDVCRHHCVSNGHNELLLNFLELDKKHSCFV